MGALESEPDCSVKCVQRTIFDVGRAGSDEDLYRGSYGGTQNEGDVLFSPRSTGGAEWRKGGGSAPDVGLEGQLPPLFTTLGLDDEASLAGSAVVPVPASKAGKVGVAVTSANSVDEAALPKDLMLVSRTPVLFGVT